MTKQEIIQAVKQKWIEDFGSLNDTHERNGYFFVGFLEKAIGEDTGATINFGNLGKKHKEKILKLQ